MKGKNKKQNNQEDDNFDLTSVLDMVSGMMGENIKSAKSSQDKKDDVNNDDESISLNDIFNISAQILKESNISESLSALLKNNQAKDSDQQDPSPDKPIKKKNKQTNDPFASGILNMVTGFVKEESKRNTALNLQSDIKKLRRKINKLNKELLELKQMVNDTNKKKNNNV
jgi:hypothetical protein